MVDNVPNLEMVSEAERGLEWRREYGRGGTDVGVARARDIANRKNLSDDTVKRMHSFFSRHAVNYADHYDAEEPDGGPTAFRISWALWGGNPGREWAARKVEDMDRAEPGELKLGDFVEWESSGGMARGQIEHVMTEGVLGIPGSDFSINANEDDPAALIRIFRNGEPTETLVGHRFSTLTKIEPIEPAQEARPYPNEHAARIADPDQFDRFVRVNDEFDDGIDAIYGVKGDEGAELQSIRFDASKHSAADARTWLNEHDFEPIKFEEAMEERNAPMSDELEQRHVVDVSETEETVTITLAKDHEPTIEADVEIDAENGGHMDEERKAPAEMKTRKLAMRMDAEMDSEDDRRMSISVSSEAPVDRSFGVEILDHNDRSIDLSFLNSGNAPLLLDHDPERQIGVIESVNLDSSARRLRATVRFSKGQLGSEVYDDVRDGIRKNVSIGYQIERMERDEKASGGNTYRVRSWKPFEASIVSIPADDSVGTNRNAEIEQTVNPIPAKAERKETKMSDQDIQAVEANVRAEYAKTVNDILELGAAKNKRDLADQAIKNGLSVEQFRGMLAVATADQPLTTADEIGMEAKEVRRFSLINAIRAMANPTDINAQRAAQFEFEASAEAQRKLGRETRGLMIPGDVLRQWNQRDINTTDDAALIAEDLRTGDFIDVLRNSSSVMAAGARMLSGLQGDVVIPKKTAASTANWIATEGAAATESEPTLGSVTMSMKTVGATTDVTRNMMHQSSMDIETLIRDDLTQSIASAIDLGALAGSGSSGQPTGIKNTSGINAPTNFAAANPTFAEVVAMETAVAEDNALAGSLAYILPAGMYGALKTTAVDSGSGRFVADGGLMNGYNAIVSNQATAGDLYFGDFSQLLVGMYGGLELIVDPYSSSKSGGVSITALQSCDVAVRHAVAFAFNNDGA